MEEHDWLLGNPMWYLWIDKNDPRGPTRVTQNDEMPHSAIVLRSGYDKEVLEKCPAARNCGWRNITA